MSKTDALIYAADRIRVNSVHPGFIRTPMVEQPLRDSGATDLEAAGVSKRMIFASGRPGLLVPTDWSPERVPHRIVVGWNGGREATRAITDALPLLVAAEAVHLIVAPDARIRALYGQDPAPTWPRTWPGKACRYCSNNARGDAGAVLLHRCAAIEADLLVMGAMGRPRISAFVFGGATHTVLARARVPLLLSH